MLTSFTKRLSIIAITLATANIAFAGTNYSYKQEAMGPVYNNPANMQTALYPQDNVLRGNVVMVPAGIPVKAAVTRQLSSADMTLGETVTMALSGDFNYNGKIIAPAGSTVTGTVVEVSKAKHGSMNGTICVRFTQIITPVGTQIPIAAVIKTNDGSGLLVGGTKPVVAKEYTTDLAVGSAAGALSGLVFGALAGGDKLGRGVALGTAVGAGGGLVKSVWDKGNNVCIPANASVELLLTQPITTSASNYSYEN